MVEREAQLFERNIASKLVLDYVFPEIKNFSQCWIVLGNLLALESFCSRVSKGTLYKLTRLLVILLLEIQYTTYTWMATQSESTFEGVFTQVALV